MANELGPSSGARTRDDRRFAVIALGASAGGIEALARFFAGVGSRAAAAFVVIQHMEPGNEAMLCDVLRKETALPVVLIDEGMVLQPGRVHVVPADFYVSLQQGVLYLVEPVLARSQRLPIDFLFELLARDMRGRAVAVVLSGAGQDGAHGVQAIRARGGLVAVQDPSGAGWPSMPDHVLETGLVDVLGEPDELYDLIERELQRPRQRRARADLALSDRQGTLLARILQRLTELTGHDFSPYKRNTLYRRIERRMNQCDIARLDGYLDYLQHNVVEAETLLRELLISVTRFFRDTDVWAQLRHALVPALIARAGQEQPLRAWVPGCATGEEAYSLAMVFLEAVDELGLADQVSLQIFATDLDQGAIAHARKGLYPLTVAPDVGEERLQRFFVHEPQGYRVCKQVREMVIFAPHNLLTDPPFSRLDLLTCRNLLIYLAPEVHERLLARFHYSMNPDALLVLGSSESIGAATHLFRPLFGHLQLYQRLNTPLNERRLDFAAEPAPVPSTVSALAMPHAIKPVPSADLQALSDQFLLRHYAPTAIITAQSGEILHISGKTDDFLELAQGKAQFNVLVMARDFLKGTLNEAFHDAVQRQEPVALTTEPDPADVLQQVVEVNVHPLRDPGLGKAMLVVLQRQATHAVSPPDPDRRQTRQIERMRFLEQALQQAREEIQATREEMQTSREELTSTNEELQSTNEELTTSAEELRTMNEELMRARAAAEQTLARYTDLFDSAPVGYFSLDRAGCIVQANRAGGEMLDMERERLVGSRLVLFVLEADRERFLQCVEQTFVTGDMQLCEIAVWRGVGVVRDVQVSSLLSPDGSTCRLASMDITERKRAEAALRSSEEWFRTLWETTTDVVLVLDGDNRIRYVNPAVSETFGYQPDELVGQDLAVLQPERLRDGHRAGLEHFSRTGEKRVDWRLTRTAGLHRSGREFPVEISFSHMELDGRSQFAGFIRDVSGRQQAEAREATHARAMTLIATGSPLQQVLDAIVQGVESELPGTLCSVLLLDDKAACLHTAAAPSLPPEFVQAIEGVAIGPVAGSCGTAAYFGRRVIVEDIATDPLWRAWRKVARQSGLASCWSEPVRNSAGRVLGTFAIYYTTPHTPNTAAIDCITAAARLASVAIERHQIEEQLARMRELLETSQAVAHIGGFELDLANGDMLWSAEMYRIHDLAPEEFSPGQDAFMRFLTPSSRELVQQARQRALDEGVATDLELELVTARGRHVWVEVRARIHRSGEGPGRVVGTVQDITGRKQAAAALRAGEERLRLALSATHQGLYDLDLKSGRATVDAEYAGMLGYEPAGFQESFSSWAARVHPDDREATLRQFRDYVDGRSPEYRAEFRLRTRADEWIWVLSVGAVVERDEAGRATRVLGTHVNISERRQAEERLQLAALVYEHSSEAMMVCAADNAIIAINPAFTQLTGYTAEEAIGRNPGFLSSGRHEAAFYDDMYAALRSHGYWQGEVWNRRKNGEVFAEALSINTIRDASGAVQRYVALFSDITEKKESEALIWQQANFDPLTHLPNRRMFRDRLERDMQKSGRDEVPLAVLFIDLDRFKEVNDTLGHDKGDILLVEAARRIRSCVRQTDTVARLGGDEFTVTLTGLEESGRVDIIARNIIETLCQPFVLGRDQAFVSASIGITLYPDDADDIDELLKHADQALYAAKDAGRNRFSYFTPELQSAALERMRLTTDLRFAIEQRQFELYFQPVVELATGRICKAEALIRWQHPQRGLVSPGEFIAIAESSGFISEVGQWVFHEAANWLQRWRSRGSPDFQISINQSPIEFQRDERRHVDWLAHLQALNLPGQALVVEITEGLLLDASPVVTDKLLLLRDAGIQVALDDFGTGYSSLAYLKKFDIDYLKIDQSFTRNLQPGSSDMALSEAIIVMAHKLGLKVIAEGVETPEQLALLRAAGCDFGQGYLFSTPLPADAFDALLQQQVHTAP